MTRAHLETPGPPVRIRALVLLTGFSRHKIYADIQRGKIEVIPLQCGSLTYWHVERQEALRYLDAMGYRWQVAS